MCNVYRIVLGLLFSLLSVSGALAQTSLVKDINTNKAGVNGSYPKFFTRCGSYLYFIVSSEHGRELWRTDGTTAGTVEVKDLNKGFTNGTSSDDFACIGSQLLYSGDNGESGVELWKTNGQVNIVQQLKDIVPGERSSFPYRFLEFNGKAYFFTPGATANKIELWQSNGTAGGTQFIKEITYDDFNSVLFAVSGQNYFYFTCIVTTSSSTTSQLWRSDGTSDGTIELKAGSYYLNNLTPVGDKLYFVNYDATSFQLWRTNGTIAGTVQVKELGVTIPDQLFAYNDKVIFNADGIWVSDGTESGTTNLTTGNLSAGCVYNGQFYGVGVDYSTDTNFLLRTNGLAANTEKIVDLGGVSYDIRINGELPMLGDKFILPVYDNEHGQEIGSSDRTQAGTIQLRDIFPGTAGSNPNSWSVLGSKIIFLADDGDHGTELWISDGTSGGTTLLKDCNPGTDNSLYPFQTNLESLNSQVYLLAGTTANDFNFNLWRSDGTDVGTNLYYDFDQSPFFVGRKNSDLYYLSAYKLFKTTGLDNGTTMIKDFSSEFGSGPFIASHEKPALLGDKMIFHVNSSLGSEYWMTNGTTLGTTILKDINPGSASGVNSVEGQVINTSYIFQADDGTFGKELWITNGTEAGTTLLKDINATGSSTPSSFALLNGKLFFSADDGVNGTELWQTNGTNAGTTMLIDIIPSLSGSNPKSLTTVGNLILFTAYDETRGWTLWKTDGTSAGTTFIKDMYPGVETERYPTNLTESNGKLFFSVNDGAHGNEVWVSDGTATGTILLDIVPGAESSNPSMFTTIEGITYFRANGELWRTDGTVLRTERVSDMDPISMVYNNGWIYFISATPAYGAELYKIQFTKFGQSITIQAIPIKVLGDSPFTVVATSNSGLPVSLSSANSKVTLNSNEVTLVSAGSATIKGNQSGNSIFAAALEASQTFCINPPKPVLTISGNSMRPVLTSSNSEGNIWFLNGILITSATEKTLIAEETGTYTVQTSIDNCTSVLSDEQAVTVTGIEKQDYRIMIFPNPATETVRIEVKGFSTAGTIQVTDMTGRVLGEYNISLGNSILDHNVSDYPSAMYIVKVIVQDAVKVKKFVKK